MMNIENIRDTLERSPRLWFTSKMNMIQQIGGMRHATLTEKESIVDYQDRLAKIITKTTENEYSQTVKEYYRDSRRRIIIESTVEELNQDTSTEMSESEFERLFAKDGALRPISCDALVKIENNLENQNILEFKAMPEKLENNGNAEIGSNLIFSLCSEDTLKINALSSQALSPNKDALVVTDMEMIIHLAEKKGFNF